MTTLNDMIVYEEHPTKLLTPFETLWFTSNNSDSYDSEDDLNSDNSDIDDLDSDYSTS
jgi:hypothetical protein